MAWPYPTYNSMTEKDSTSPDLFNQVCSTCIFSYDGCPYDLFSPPQFPCPDYIPIDTPGRERKRKPTPEGRKKSQREYYDRNKAKARQYYLKNKEQRRAYQKLYRELNIERIREKDREYQRNKRKNRPS